MEGFTLAIKCLSLGVVHVTSFHNSLAITSRMEPSNRKETRKSNPPMSSEGESQKLYLYSFQCLNAHALPYFGTFPKAVPSA